MLIEILYKDGNRSVVFIIISRTRVLTENKGSVNMQWLSSYLFGRPVIPSDVFSEMSPLTFVIWDICVSRFSEIWQCRFGTGKRQVRSSERQQKLANSGNGQKCPNTVNSRRLKFPKSDQTCR